jgi:hypothetical protein
VPAVIDSLVGSAIGSGIGSMSHGTLYALSLAREPLHRAQPTGNRLLACQAPQEA